MDRKIPQRRAVRSLSQGERAGVRASVKTNSTEDIEESKSQIQMLKLTGSDLILLGLVSFFRHEE
jgi:hypothetical protein